MQSRPACLLDHTLVFGTSSIRCPQSRAGRHGGGAAVRAKTVYLDGELCGVGEDGPPSFAETQAAADRARGVCLVFYAFDAPRGTTACRLTAMSPQPGESFRFHSCAFSVVDLQSRQVAFEPAVSRPVVRSLLEREEGARSLRKSMNLRFRKGSP